MTIKLVRHPPDGAELRLEGRLDSASAPSAQEGMLRVCGEYRSVVLNFAGLDYISSAGLRVLLSLQKKMNAGGGTLSVVGVKPSVQEIFEMTGFSSILHID
jgi:anti-sigma B factor antagonist